MRQRRGRREPMGEARQAVGEHRLVDGGLEAPARLGLPHRQDQPVAAAAEVEPGLRLDDHRQQLWRRASGAGGEKLTAERPDRQLDADARRERRRPRPAAITTVSASSSRVSAGGVLPQLDPELHGAPHELAGHGRRVGDAVLRAEDRPEHVARLEPGHERRVDALHRDAEPACTARRSSSAARPPRSSPGRGSRPGGRTAGRARRRTRCSPAPGVPRRRSRTAAERRRAPAVEPPAIRPGRRGRRRGRRRARAGRRSRRPSRRRRRRGSRQLEPRQLLGGEAAKRRAHVVRDGHPAPADDRFSAAWKGKPSSVGAEALGLVRALLARLAHKRGDHLGKDARRGPRRRPPRRPRAREPRAPPRRRRVEARRAGTARPSPRACRRP